MNFPQPQHPIKIQEPDVHHFVNYCLFGGAVLKRLDINIHDSNWPGYCNPSIMWDEKDQDFKIIVRNVNYVLHGSKDQYKNSSNWGPVLYSIPQSDGRNLKTRNFIGASKDPINEPMTFNLINTKEYTPIWEFQGEEDARIVRWNDKLYTTGVRRDDNTDGRGRMELMQIDENTFSEISKLKIKAINKKSYCEKNWMPIKDMPFHYVQLANPTVVVKVDPDTGDATEIVRKEKIKEFENKQFDLLRGSSQVIRWGDYWVALVHTCELWLTASNRKFSRYLHAFIMWDNDWNIVKISPLFSFSDYAIEFTCGLEYHNGKFYIPFAIEDNFSFLMEVNEEVIHKFIDNDESVKYADTENFTQNNFPHYLNIFSPVKDQRKLFEIGISYYTGGFLAAAYNIFCRSIEMFDYTYIERFMAARCIADLGNRDAHEIAMWMHCIMHDEKRPEGYMAAAMYYKCRGAFIEALYYAQKAKDIMKGYDVNNLIYYTPDAIENLYLECLWETPWYEKSIEYFDRNSIEHDNDRRVL